MEICRANTMQSRVYFIFSVIPKYQTWVQKDLLFCVDSLKKKKKQQKDTQVQLTFSSSGSEEKGKSFQKQQYDSEANSGFSKSVMENQSFQKAYIFKLANAGSIQT